MDRTSGATVGELAKRKPIKQNQVTVSSTGASQPCAECCAPLDHAEMLCGACGAFNGYPNVRRWSTTDNLQLVEKKFQEARSQAFGRGAGATFDAFVVAVEQQAGAVVAIPPIVLRALVSSPKILYAGYENMVAGRVRTSAPAQHDAMRRVVGSIFFPGYAEDIVYAALSLTGDGVASYGDVQCRLKIPMIEKRAIVLIDNSFTVVEHSGKKDATLPLGCAVPWTHRAKLAAIKVGSKLDPSKGPEQFQELMFQTDGKTRSTDVFLEVAIHGSFNAHSIEGVKVAQGKVLDRAAQLDFDLATTLLSEI